MARAIPLDRLDQLAAKATDVFIEQGYRHTQMADVADALGVAKGTLYLYVESKDALFDWVCRCADAPAPLPKPARLPMPTPRPGATARYIRERLARDAVPSALAAALARTRVPDAAAELEGVVGELYDTLARNRCGIKLLDRAARDLPELAALWFAGARGGLIAALAQYLTKRIEQKRLRPVPDATAAARLIIETTVFWAVHRHWDVHPQRITDAVERDTVIRFVGGALRLEAGR
jgi:AcrR family transcriptional regulator